MNTKSMNALAQKLDELVSLAQDEATTGPDLDYRRAARTDRQTCQQEIIAMVEEIAP